MATNGMQEGGLNHGWTRMTPERLRFAQPQPRFSWMTRARDLVSPGRLLFDDEHELAVKQIPEPDPRLSVPGSPRDSPRKTRGTNLLAYVLVPATASRRLSPSRGEGCHARLSLQFKNTQSSPRPRNGGEGSGVRGHISMALTPASPL